MLGLNDIILTTLINIIILSMNIGKLIQQPGGHKAFIPEKFPPGNKIIINTKTQQLHAKAVLMLGKLDGVTQLLPDLDFFILMYIRKEAAKSSEITGLLFVFPAGNFPFQFITNGTRIPPSSKIPF